MARPAWPRPSNWPATGSPACSSTSLRPGGVVYRGPLRAGVDPAYLGARYTRALEKLRRDFAACAGHIDLRLNSRVVGGDSQRLMILDEAEQLHEMTYSHLLLATGCHERSVPFPGWTLPGVMLLGGLQLQIKSGAVKPLGDTLIAGSGPLLPLVACQLHAAGYASPGSTRPARSAAWPGKAWRC